MRAASRYALTRDTNATKLTPSQPASNGYMSIYVHDQLDGNTAVQFAPTSMPDFLDNLMNFIPDRQTVDATGLTGQYDFTLSFFASTIHGDQGPEVPGKTTAFVNALPHSGFKLVPRETAVARCIN